MTETDDSTQLPELPWEIIVYILTKLPVKTLVQSKCVSKPWRSLISSRDFVKMHLRMSIEDESCTYHRAIVSTISHNPGFKFCSLTSVYNDPFLDAIELDYPFSNTYPIELDYSMGYPYPRLIGCCNGLLCIAYRRDRVYLWNPCIREFKILPKLDLFGVESRSGYDIEFGFGYDHSTDDYKVVGISRFSGKGDPSGPESQVKVYSLRANSWRMIQEFPYGPDYNEPGKFVSGALIWSAMRTEITNGSSMSFWWLIIALDLKTETFSELPKPVENTGLNRLLGTFQGCVSILANYQGFHADLWVMKEYGVPESWTKLLTIPYVPYPWPLSRHNFRHNFPYYRSLCSSKNGEILMVFHSRLILYDSKNNAFRYPMIHHLSCCVKADIYAESLVSPNAMEA